MPSRVKLLLLLAMLRLRLVESLLLSPPLSPNALYSTYDFIVVGSGSAGSVLAHRLSEVSKWRVLLLEVGHRPTLITEVPAFAPILQFTGYTWPYRMEPTPGACQGIVEKRCPWPRGRGLGGSSLINYMIYTRGHRADFNRWAAEGNPGWAYEDVLPYFWKSENANLGWSDERYHRKDGLLSVENVPYRSEIPLAFLKGAQELGLNSFNDYNGREQLGFGYVQANTKGGRRHSGYRAFIATAEHRKNLHILMGSRVTRILINNGTGTVYGVQFVKGRRYWYVNATKEVILCAGVFISPQLLMLSGIGPKAHLNTHGIPLIRNLPGVGQNLHDHIGFVGLFFTINDNVKVVDSRVPHNPIKSILDWWSTGNSPLSSLGGVEALGFIRTNVSFSIDADPNVPDMELFVMSEFWGVGVAKTLKQVMSVNDDIYNKIWKQLIDKKIIIIVPMHLKPRSTGYLELKSRNPYHWPRLYGNYLSDPSGHDIRAFIAAIRFIQRLTATPAFRAIGAKLVDIPLPGCERLVYDSDAYWECAVRHVSTSIYHQVGTCKMGPLADPLAVVDQKLRVHGINRLRVVDTSIIPFSLNAHTNAPTYMVGEKAADYIKKTWLN